MDCIGRGGDGPCRSSFTSPFHQKGQRVEADDRWCVEIVILRNEKDAGYSSVFYPLDDSKEKRMWNERYSSEAYAYGIEPNAFLTAMYDKLPSGRILCIGEGEGRNAVWLAGQGNTVTAVDLSEVGLKKANKLAESRGVTITTVHADLADYEIEKEQWDAIVSLFCHLPPALRKNVHHRCVEGLRPGGVFLLEAYTPLQLEYKTGGPQTVEMMMDVASLTTELAGMEFIHLQERIREVNEGDFHNGTGAVVQVFGKRELKIMQ